MMDYSNFYYINLYKICDILELKFYNYFVRGVVLFFLIIIPFTIVTNPEMIEDEVDLLYIL